MPWIDENLDGASRWGFDMGLLERMDGPLGEIAVWRHPVMGNFLQMGGSFMTAEADEAFYHEALAHPLLCSVENPERIFVAGGGDGGLARECLRHGPRGVLVGELDPRVPEVSKRWLPGCAASFSDPRVSLLMGDAMVLLESQPEGSLDAILLDLPDPEGPVAGFYTVEFFNMARGRLRPGGGLALQAGPLFFRGGRISGITDALRASFRSVLPYLCHVPSYGGECLFAMASDSDLSPPSAEGAGVVFSKRRISGLSRCSPEAMASMFAIPPWAAARLSPAWADVPVPVTTPGLAGVCGFSVPTPSPWTPVGSGRRGRS